jgi:hypothetical protein
MVGLCIVDHCSVIDFYDHPFALHGNVFGKLNIIFNIYLFNVHNTI